MSDLLDMSGIGRERLQLRWVSSAEGKLFADYVCQVTEIISNLGKFDPEAHRLPLAAIRRTLETPRVRWLTGMEKELVEHQNVYGKKVDQTKYQEVLQGAIRHEYNKSLILELLAGTEGQQVRQLAEKTGLDLHTISNCLVELEKNGLAALAGYDGQHPKFISLAA